MNHAYNLKICSKWHLQFDSRSSVQNNCPKYETQCQKSFKFTSKSIKTVPKSMTMRPWSVIGAKSSPGRSLDAIWHSAGQRNVSACVIAIRLCGILQFVNSMHMGVRHWWFTKTTTNQIPICLPMVPFPGFEKGICVPGPHQSRLYLLEMCACL